jgi:hypothetical protein
MNQIDNLRQYMFHYPGNFVGFFTDVSKVLKSLGKDWSDFGRKEWGDAFNGSSDKLLQVAGELAIVRDEHDLEQKDPMSLIKNYTNLLDKIVAK